MSYKNFTNSEEDVSVPRANVNSLALTVPLPEIEQPPIVLQPTDRSDEVPARPATALDYLKTISKIHVKQSVEYIDVYVPNDMRNRYTIMNEEGAPIFYVLEDSDLCDRMCCTSLRALNLKVYDFYRNQTIQVNRPFNCQGCCCPCSLQEMEICSPPGNVIGTVQEEWTLLYSNLTVKDETGQTVFTIKGPWWFYSCGGDIDFRVSTADGFDVAKITKRWTGFYEECMNHADDFCLEFPKSMDLKHKTLLLGALFLVDFMHFEIRKYRRFLKI